MNLVLHQGNHGEADSTDGNHGDSDTFPVLQRFRGHHELFWCLRFFVENSVRKMLEERIENAVQCVYTSSILGIYEKKLASRYHSSFIHRDQEVIVVSKGDVAVRVIMNKEVLCY